jgi:thiopeptide-type bacteriocin biosynthesis protein
LDDRQFREALFLSSRSLANRLETAHDRNPWRGRGYEKIERSLVRYLLRMTLDCTPYGLSAGYSIGRVARTRQLGLPPSSANRRSSRLSAALVQSMIEKICKHPAVRHSIRWTTTTPLALNANQFRYYERIWGRDGLATRICGLRKSAALDRVAAYAAIPRTFDGIVSRMVAGQEGLARATAKAFVDSLIDIGFLVPGEARCTAGSRSRDLGKSLGRSRHAGDTRRLWAGVEKHLKRLDDADPGGNMQRYRAVLSEFGKVCDLAIPPRPFDVSVKKSARDLKLDGRTVESALVAASAIGGGGGSARAPIAQFAKRFVRRYGDAFVSLLDVFDTGIGLPWMSEASESIDGADDAGPVAPGRWDAYLTDCATSSTWPKLEQMDLPEELARSVADDGSPGGSGYMLISLLSERWRAHRQNDSIGMLYGVGGSCGAELISHGCLHDPELHALAKLCAMREERGEADTVFAEIAHVPDGWAADIVERPAIRKYHIECLNAGVRDRTRRIALEELVVGVRHGHFVLWSRSLGKRVKPRLTSAYDASTSNLPIFRFLASLRDQESEEVRFRWPAALEQSTHLPRVRYNKWIVSRARWTLTEDQRSRLLEGSDTQRFSVVQELRGFFGWPRFVEVADGQRSQFIDLDNPISVFALCAAHKGGRISIHEVLDEPRLATVRSPDGCFRHEMVVPFAKRRAQADRVQRVEAGDGAPFLRADGRRRSDNSAEIPVSSEKWIYVKLFAGASLIDLLLLQYVWPLVKRLKRDRLIDRWFFVRYADPDSHLRLRLRLSDIRQLGRVARAVRRVSGRASAARCSWLLEWAEYSPEDKEYGGRRPRSLSEEVFAIDSEAVIKLLSLAGSSRFAGRRWLLGVMGMNSLMLDFGLDQRDANELLGAVLANSTAVAKPEKGAIAAIYRAQQAVLSDLLTSAERGHPAAVAARALRERSKSLSRVARRMQRLTPRDLQGVTTRQLVANYLHMFANRLFSPGDGKDEYLAYELLRRLTRAHRVLGEEP